MEDLPTVTCEKVLYYSGGEEEIRAITMIDAAIIRLDSYAARRVIEYFQDKINEKIKKLENPT